MGQTPLELTGYRYLVWSDDKHNQQYPLTSDSIRFRTPIFINILSKRGVYNSTSLPSQHCLDLEQSLWMRDVRNVGGATPNAKTLTSSLISAFPTP